MASISVFISRAIGQSNIQAAQKWIKYLLIVFISLSVKIAILVLLFKEQFASLITSDKAIIGESQSYLEFIFAAYLPLNCLFMSTNVILITV